MSLSILLSHLCLCPVTQEQRSPGDKDGISMSLAMLNSTPKAGLAIDTVECPYPNNRDWPWVIWGDQPATWWQVDCIISRSLKSCVTSCFYWKIHLLSGKGNGTPLQYFCLENPMDGGAWWAAVCGVSKSRTRLSKFTFTFHFHFSLSCIGEGNGNPPKCSCLENPRDRGAWWAAVYGVVQNRTRLKWHSSSSTLTQKMNLFSCPQCFPPDYHDCCIHSHGFPHSFASEPNLPEFPF